MHLVAWFDGKAWFQFQFDVFSWFSRQSENLAIRVIVATSTTVLLVLFKMLILINSCIINNRIRRDINFYYTGSSYSFSFLFKLASISNSSFWWMISFKARFLMTLILLKIYKLNGMFYPSCSLKYEFIIYSNHFMGEFPFIYMSGYCFFINGLEPVINIRWNVIFVFEGAEVLIAG
jgi:hypothetical protein